MSYSPHWIQVIARLRPVSVLAPSSLPAFNVSYYLWAAFCAGSFKLAGKCIVLFVGSSRVEGSCGEHFNSFLGSCSVEGPGGERLESLVGSFKLGGSSREELLQIERSSWGRL
jgi:hypothetical protein